MTRTRYEYRLHPNDCFEVQVRPVRKRNRYTIGQGWRCYMFCTSPASAYRILAMLLEPERVETMVTR